MSLLFYSVSFFYSSRDKLYIHDGPNSNSHTVQGSGQFLTGNGKEGAVFTSTGQDIFLRFLSDDSSTFPGFLIEFEQGKIYFLFSFKIRFIKVLLYKCMIWFGHLYV